jgi:hypothetical protein
MLSGLMRETISGSDIFVISVAALTLSLRKRATSP